MPDQFVLRGPSREAPGVTTVVVVTPLAVTAIVTSRIPDGLGDESTAEPATSRRFVATRVPFSGVFTVTVGALVSAWPPGAKFNRTVPTLAGSKLARAARYVTPAFAVKLTNGPRRLE